ncbi:hypothetical protein AB0C77_37520, partial [Streptomyces sp. NPDC048629]|uniref:hypothetical protein n=1 Tax=Streptomyces sp. NPDC048629 TaxID=3154824 RepID=UPI00342D4A6C
MTAEATASAGGKQAHRRVDSGFEEGDLPSGTDTDVPRGELPSVAPGPTPESPQITPEPQAPTKTAEARSRDAVFKTLDAFPEIREAAGEKPVGALLESLSGAQRVKLDHLLRENGLGLENVGLDAVGRSLDALGEWRDVAGRPLSEQLTSMPELDRAWFELRLRENLATHAGVDALAKTLETFPELRGTTSDQPVTAYLDRLTPAQRVQFDALLGDHGLKDVVREAVTETLSSFPELGGVAGDKPLSELMDALTPAQLTKFESLLGENGRALRDAGLDVSALLRDGFTERALADQPGLLKDLLPASAEPAAHPGDGALEAKALHVGMTPEEVASYTERYDAAMGKGDPEAGAAIAQQRQRHIEQLEAARDELAFRRTGEAEGTPDPVAAARVRARDAGVSDATWEVFESLITDAVTQERLADAHALIRERHQLVEELEAAGDRGTDAALTDRLDRLRGSRGGGEEPSGASTGQGPDAPESAPAGDVQALLDSLPPLPDGQLPVTRRDVETLEALVTQSRTAELPPEQLTAWRDRFAEALGKGDEGRADLMEVAREWQKSLDDLTGAHRPGVDELFESPELRVKSQQELLVEAAEQAGLSFEEHASRMKNIRDAWAEGRTADAERLVGEFWDRIEQATAEKSTAADADGLRRLAEHKGMGVEEYVALRERQQAAERALEEELRALAEGPSEDPDGLTVGDRLRRIADNLPEDAAGSATARRLEELLDRASLRGDEQTLRDDLVDMLDAGMWDRLEPLLAEPDPRMAELEALPRTPQGDRVWAAQMKESLSFQSDRHGMPEGEVSYWRDKLDDLVESDGDRAAVIELSNEWNVRVKKFEVVEKLAAEAETARQDPVDRADWQEKLTNALRQEDHDAFSGLERQWRAEIADAKARMEFETAITEVAGGLKDKAETLGMTAEEWAGLQERIERAQEARDVPELLRLIDERAARLDELQTAWHAGTADRLTALRDGAPGGPAQDPRHYADAVEPEWRTQDAEGKETVSREGDLWELFEEKKPAALKDVRDPENDPFRGLDDEGEGPDGPDGPSSDAQLRRRVDELRGDLFADAKSMKMSPDEIAVWKERLARAEAAGESTAPIREALRHRIDVELAGERTTDARLQAFEKNRRQELLDLGFTPHELNAHELGVRAASKAGREAEALRLKTEFDAVVEARRIERAASGTGLRNPLDETITRGSGDTPPRNPLDDLVPPPAHEPRGVDTPRSEQRPKLLTPVTPGEELLMMPSPHRGGDTPDVRQPHRTLPTPDELLAGTTSTPDEPLTGTTTKQAPDPTDTLQELSGVVDTDALRAFEAGEYQTLPTGPRLQARKIVDETMLFPLTIADHGEGLKERQPLEYWTVAAVAQAMTAGQSHFFAPEAQAAARRLAEEIREDRELPRPVPRQRGGAPNPVTMPSSSQTGETSSAATLRPPATAWDRYQLPFEESTSPPSWANPMDWVLAETLVHNAFSGQDASFDGPREQV